MFSQDCNLCLVGQQDFLTLWLVSFVTVVPIFAIVCSVLQTEFHFVGRLAFFKFLLYIYSPIIL